MQMLSLSDAVDLHCRQMHVPPPLFQHTRKRNQRTVAAAPLQHNANNIHDIVNGKSTTTYL